MPPPTSGGVTTYQILKQLEPFQMDSYMPNSVKAIHLFSESAKLAYADRALYLADPDFVDVPTQALMNEQYLSNRSKLISLNKVIEKASAGQPNAKEFSLLAPDQSIEFPSTTHFVIVDKYKNVLSMTSTIESAFGSRIMVEGFLLNNELTDFSFTHEKDGKKIANRVQPGKRPRSSMAPTIVFKNDEPYLAIGSPGGSRIINYVAQSLVAILDWNMDVNTAIALPHIVNRNSELELEANTDLKDVKPYLEKLGHKVIIKDQTSGLHGILLKDGKLIGGADPRREGYAISDIDNHSQ